MNASMRNIDMWFAQNKLNLNPSKTRYSIFKPKANDPLKEETDLIKIDDQYLQRVWRKGKEKAFKLVGVWIDEELKWNDHIQSTVKKVNSAIYGIARTYKNLSKDNKKLLYMGLIQSHLVYGAAFWGMAKTSKLEPLRIAQKRAIRKVHDLKYRDHTHKYFTESRILKLDDLINYATLTYMQSSTFKFAPEHTKQLWQKKQRDANLAFNLRDFGEQMVTVRSGKQWIHDLPNNKQAKLWNSCVIDTTIEPKEFKRELKNYILDKYLKELNDNMSE
jgi:hypothetical protein